MGTTLRGEKSEGKSTIRSTGGIAVLEESYSFLVEADSVTVSRLEVLNTTGLPIVNESTSASGFCICQHLDATRREDQRTLWDVTATFSSEVSEGQSGSGGGGGVNTDPVEWIPVYETKFERLQEQVTTDAAGVSVANSAGQPYENGIIRARFIPIWDFFQFERASVDDEEIIDRNETVNDAVFKGRAEKTLLLTVVSSVIGFYYGQRKRLTKYSLRYNSKTWKHKRLDVGTVFLEDGVYKPYLDDEGNVMLGALNGAGAKQAPGVAPAVQEFDMYPAINFNAFLRR